MRGTKLFISFFADFLVLFLTKQVHCHKIWVPKAKILDKGDHEVIAYDFEVINSKIFSLNGPKMDEIGEEFLWRINFG